MDRRSGRLALTTRRLDHLRLNGPSLALAASAASVTLTALIAAVPDSPITPVLPPGAEALAPFRAPARALGLFQLSKIGKVVFAASAAVFAAIAFGLALWHAWRGTVSLRTVLIMGVCFHVVVVTLPVLLAEDVFLYAGFGRIAGLHHANPYLVPAMRFPSDQFVRYVPAEWRNFLPYYGPALLLGARTATNVFRSLPGVLLSFKVLAGACSLATLLLVAWLGRRLWPSRATFAVCLLALNPLVLFHVVGGAHIDAFIALAVVGAWALITGAEGRAPPVQAALELVATGLMASAAMVKPPIAMALLLFVPEVVARRPKGDRLRIAVGHFVVTVAIALAFSLPFLQSADPSLGVARLLGWVSPLGVPTFFRIAVVIVSGQVGLQGWGAPLEILVRLAFALTFVLALWALVRRAVKGAPLDPVERGAIWGWGWLVLLLTSPQLHSWYLIWVLPFAWVLPRTPRMTLVAMSLILPLVSFIPARIGYFGIANSLKWFQITVVVPVLFVLLVDVLRDLADRSRQEGPLRDENSATGGRSRPPLGATTRPGNRGEPKVNVGGLPGPT